MRLLLDLQRIRTKGDYRKARKSLTKQAEAGGVYLDDCLLDEMFELGGGEFEVTPMTPRSMLKRNRNAD